MFTKILDAINYQENSINEAIDWLKYGEPIAFPTETVYGLGAGLFDYNAVEKIFKIKGRAFTNPLAAHISNIEDVEILCKDIKDEFYLLAEKFLPGPLSIVLHKKDIVPKLVSGGGDTISIRMPRNDIFMSLSKQLAQPIAATSANKSGRPSPTSAEFVYDDLNGKIPIILNAGKCRYQIESTVISLINDSPELIRPGAISQNEIEEFLGKKIISRDKQIVLSKSNTFDVNNLNYQLIIIDDLINIDKILLKNNSKKIAFMAKNTNIIDYNIDKIETNEIDFFNHLRYIEKNNFDILIIYLDEYIKSSEVLRHRLKIN